MKINTLLYPIVRGLLATFVLTLVACGSHRKVVSDGTMTSEGDLSSDISSDGNRLSVVSFVNAQRQKATGLRSKISMRLAADGREVTVGGSLKMKRDVIIQLQLTALGLLEVGRLELTPDYLFVQDKINKRYARIRWEELPGIQGSGIGFSTFQSLFWNELFVWGKRTAPEDSDFSVTLKKKNIQLAPASVTPALGDLALRFLVDAGSHLLQQTSVSTQHKNKLSFTCDYQDFDLLDARQFPHQLSLTVATGARSYRADIVMNRLQVDESMGALATSVNNLSYKQVSFDEIMNLITKHTSK